MPLNAALQLKAFRPGLLLSAKGARFGSRMTPNGAANSHTLSQGTVNLEIPDTPLCPAIESG
jgi:hypothetical protein